ncbi:MAG: hypothetical protein ACLUTY_06950 [Waltera sp.]
MPEQNDGVETEAQDGQSEADDSQAAVSVPTDNGFDDELIIAYNADSKGYAVYSAQDLLTEEDEKLVSVDKKMDEYLQNGGELTGTAPKIQSLEVNRSQKKWYSDLCLVIGIADAGMLTILAVQNTQDAEDKSVEITDTIIHKYKFAGNLARELIYEERVTAN